MIYQFIENLTRLIMEWSIRRQKKHRPLVSEIAEKLSFRAPKIKD